MGQTNKIFICSSDLFHGYKLSIDLNKCDNIQDIITIFKKSLFDLLENNNLEILISEINSRRFHIHTHTFEEILISKRDTIYYICDNCIEKNNNIIFNSNSL